MKAKVFISDAFKITGRGTVVVCMIEEGSISVGDKIKIGEIEYEISGVEGFSGGMKPNFNVGLILKSQMDPTELKEEILKHKNTKADIL